MKPPSNTTSEIITAEPVVLRVLINASCQFPAVASISSLSLDMWMSVLLVLLIN
jgi:hypothetical protein